MGQTDGSQHCLMPLPWGGTEACGRAVNRRSEKTETRGGGKTWLLTEFRLNVPALDTKQVILGDTVPSQSLCWYTTGKDVTV